MNHLFTYEICQSDEKQKPSNINWVSKDRFCHVVATSIAIQDRHLGASTESKAAGTSVLLPGDREKPSFPLSAFPGEPFSTHPSFLPLSHTLTLPPHTHSHMYTHSHTWTHTGQPTLLFPNTQAAVFSRLECWYEVCLFWVKKKMFIIHKANEWFPSNFLYNYCEIIFPLSSLPPTPIFSPWPPTILFLF